MADVRRRPKGIWSVGGGKGGTGKTLIASNMAIYLAKLGQRVLLIDADLGGANLHTCLGLEKPRYSLDEFLDGGRGDLGGFMVETGVMNLSLIAGSQDASGRGLRVGALRKLKQALKNVDMDYVILDIGSGTSPLVMNLFLIGGTGVYVMVPEPTSIENTYRFLKEALFILLFHGTRKKTIKEAVERAFYGENDGDFIAVSRLMEKLKRDEPKATKGLTTRVNDFCVRLVLNQVRRYEDVEVGFAVRSAIHKYFGVRVDYVGYINHDDRVMQCVRMRKPLLENFPDSNAAKCIENLTHKLLIRGQLAFDFF